MSGRSRTLKIEILGDARDAQQAFSALEQSAGGIGNRLKDVASIAGGFIIAQGLLKLPDLFNSAVEAGSNLSESINAVNQIFGDSAQQILQWGETSANSFGLSQRAFNDLAVPLGAGLKNAGLDMDDVANHTINLTERAADMASVFNTDVDEALAAIQAGLRGEADPLERFGVGLSAARVESEALAMTGKSVASELTEQEKMLARVNLIMQQTEDTAGDFTNTSDGVANSARIAAARQEELAAVIGMQLLPVQQAITQAKLEFLELLAEHVIPVVLEYGEKLGELAGRIRGPLNDAFVLIRDGVQTFAEALSGDWTDAEGIRGVHRVIGNLGTLIRDGIDTVEEWAEKWEDLEEAFEPVTDLWSDWMDDLGETYDRIVDFVSEIDSLPELLGGISSGLQNISWSDITSGLSGIGSDIASAVSESLDNVGWDEVREKIRAGVTGGLTDLQEGAEGGLEFAQGLADGLATQFEETDWSAVQTAVRDGILGGLGAAEDEAGGAGQAIQDWLTSEVEAVEDWEQLGKAVKGGVLTGISVASGGVGLALAIIDWIAGEITDGEGDWSTIASNIATKIGEGFAEAVSIGEQVLGFIQRSLSEADWEGVATAIASGLKQAVTGYADLYEAVYIDTARGLIEGIAGKISEGDSAQSLTESLGRVFTDAFGDIDLEEIIRDSGLVLTPEALFGDGGFADFLGDIVDEFEEVEQVLREDLGPTIDEIREAWEAWEPILVPITGLLLDIAASGIIQILEAFLQPVILVAEGLEALLGWIRLVAEAVELMGLHVQAGMEILEGLWETIQNGVEAVSGFVTDTLGELGGWVTTGAEKAGEFLDGVLGPIDELAIEGVKKIGELATEGPSKLGELATEGANKAQELYNSVTGKVEEMVSTATTTIGGLPGKAASAIGDLSTTLWQAGRDLVQGLIDGVTSLIPDLEGVFSGITDKIPDWKGPLERDRELLRPTGMAIMTGLVAGVDDGIPRLRVSLERATDLFTEIWNEALAQFPDDIAKGVEKATDAVVDAFEGIAGDLEGLATGEVVEKLQSELGDLLSLRDLAIEQGLGDEVVAHYEAEIARVQAELEAAGQLASSAVVQGIADEIAKEEAAEKAKELIEEARKAAEEAAQQLADEWDDRMARLLDPERTAESLQEQIDRIAEEIRMGEILGAPDVWMEERRAALEEAQEQEANFWRDLALQAASGLVDPKVLQEIGAAGNEQFLTFLEQFAGKDAAAQIVKDIGALAKLPIDELKKRFAEAPEIAGQFVDDLVKGVEDGSWAWEDVMNVLSVLPKEQLIPILEELSEKFGIDLTQAMINADGVARAFAEGGLAAVNGMLQQTQSEVDGAMSALERLTKGLDHASANWDGGGSAGGSTGGGGGSRGAGGGGDGIDPTNRPGTAIAGDFEGNDILAEGGLYWRHARTGRLRGGVSPLFVRRQPAYTAGRVREAMGDLGVEIIRAGGAIYWARGYGFHAIAFEDPYADVTAILVGDTGAAGGETAVAPGEAGLNAGGGAGLAVPGGGGPLGGGAGGPGAGNTINVNVESNDPERIAAAVDFVMRQIANDPALVGGL